MSNGVVSENEITKFTLLRIRELFPDYRGLIVFENSLDSIFKRETDQRPSKSTGRRWVEPRLTTGWDPVPNLGLSGTDPAANPSSHLRVDRVTASGWYRHHRGRPSDASVFPVPLAALTIVN